MACRGGILPALLLAAGTASASCNDGWIDIEQQRAGDSVSLRAVNRSDYPLTYSLRLRTRDMQVQGNRRNTETLPAHGRSTAVKLTDNRPDRQGRYRYFCDWTVGDMHARHDDKELYLLPYAPGRSFRVLQGFGSRFSHTGLARYAVDFSMPVGTPVHAARDGVVARIEESHDIGCGRDDCARYANFIVVLHDDGTTGEYYHLQQDGALVSEGETVVAGQKIGLSGNTGYSTMPHLHFAVYRAVERGRTQSLPMRFLSEDGIVSQPRRGGRYLAASSRSLAAARRRDTLRHAD